MATSHRPPRESQRSDTNPWVMQGFPPTPQELPDWLRFSVAQVCR